MAPFAVSEDLALEEIDVEVDEAYLGGSQTNQRQRTERERAGAAEDNIVAVFVGARNRATGHITAKVIPNRGVGQGRGFAEDDTHPESIVMTDRCAACGECPGRC